MGVAAPVSGVARRNTGLPSSPEEDAEDEDDDASDALSGARRNVGLLLSEDESEEEEAEEERRSVGRESSDGYDDPEEGYDPESFGSGWRITGR